MKKLSYFLMILFFSNHCFAAAKVGDSAYFQIKTFNQENFDIAQKRGKIVIINFWASWCSQCRKEIMVLQNIKKKYGEKVEIIGVTLDKNAKNLSKNLNYENGFSANMKSNIDEPDAIPTPYIINKDGKIAAIFDDENIEITEADFVKIFKKIDDNF